MLPGRVHPSAPKQLKCGFKWYQHRSFLPQIIWKWICASSTHLEMWGYKQIEERYIISEMMVTRNYWNMLFRSVLKFSSNTSRLCIICFSPSYVFLFCLNPWTVKSFRNFQNILDQVVPKNRIKNSSCKGDISFFTILFPNQKCPF